MNLNVQTLLPKRKSAKVRDELETIGTADVNATTTVALE